MTLRKTKEERFMDKIKKIALNVLIILMFEGAWMNMTPAVNLLYHKDQPVGYTTLESEMGFVDILIPSMVSINELPSYDINEDQLKLALNTNYIIDRNSDKTTIAGTGFYMLAEEQNKAFAAETPTDACKKVMEKNPDLKIEPTGEWTEDGIVSGSQKMTVPIKMTSIKILNETVPGSYRGFLTVIKKGDFHGIQVTGCMESNVKVIIERNTEVCVNIVKGFKLKGDIENEIPSGFQKYQRRILIGDILNLGILVGLLYFANRYLMRYIVKEEVGKE